MVLNKLGKIGEDKALKYLKAKNYRFVDRNFYCPYGEIDLIFQEKNTLVFVEVKTRWSKRYGKPSEAVTNKKIHSLIKTANWFLNINKNLPKKSRIDVIAIEVDNNANLINLKHIKNITV